MNEGGVQVIDVADPAHPQAVSNIATPWGPTVTTSGNLACVAASGAGLQIFDLTDPTNPQPQGKFDAAGALTAAGGMIYVTSPGNGFLTLRLPGPALSYRGMGGTPSLSWPTNALGFVLQSATTLTNDGNWQNSSLIPIVTNGQNVVTMNPTSPAAFFRLRQP
jgi:hypothetical protein